MNKLAIIIPTLFLFLFSNCNFLDTIGGIGLPPGFLPPPLEEFVEEFYPDYDVVDIEKTEICGDNSVRRVVLESEMGEETVLFFDMNGDFLFTVLPLDVLDLPATVSSSVASVYPDYTIDTDEAEAYELPDGSLQYKVLLTSADDPSLTIVFNEDGSLACSQENNDNGNGNGNGNNGNNNEDIPDSVQDSITNNFPDFEIEGVKLEDLCGDTEAYEIELKNPPNTKIYLYYDLNWEFLFAARDVAITDLPGVLVNSIETTYPGFTFEEEPEQYELANGSLQYKVEIETASNEKVEITMDINGDILCIKD